MEFCVPRTAKAVPAGSDWIRETLTASAIGMWKSIAFTIPAVPIIIITGRRSDEIDRTVWFELGADAYLLKPFSLRELLARVRAVLRRQHSVFAEREKNLACYCFGKWQINRRSRRLINPIGKPVALTKGEYAILIAFLDAPQRVLSRRQLLQATRLHEDISERSIDVQVMRLRRKLECDPSARRVIRAEPGEGYIFVLPVERLAVSKKKSTEPS